MLDPVNQREGAKATQPQRASQPAPDVIDKLVSLIERSANLRQETMTTSTEMDDILDDAGVAHALARRQQTEDEPRSLAAPPEPVSEIGQLIRLAIQAGQTPTELYALLKEERATRREQAFNIAFAAFKHVCPPVPRRTENTQFAVTVEGVKRKSMFASMQDICATVDPLLPTFGLSYRFTDPEIVDGKLRVVFALSHVGGHTQLTPSMWFPLGKPIVSREGKQVTTEIQAHGGTHSFVRRYAMVSGLGLATCDDDNDANEPNPMGTALSEAQVETILNLLIATSGDAKLFAKSYGAEKVADIPAKCFDPACARLNRLRNAQAKK